MVYCSKCGEDVSEDAHFCPKCGSNLIVNGLFIKVEDDKIKEVSLTK